jgi:CutC family
VLARFSLSPGFNLFFSAVKGGADRIEVCANLGVGGGTTPTLGLLKSIQNVVDVPVMVRLPCCWRLKHHILNIPIWGFRL